MLEQNDHYLKLFVTALVFEPLGGRGEYFDSLFPLSAWKTPAQAQILPRFLFYWVKIMDYKYKDIDTSICIHSNSVNLLCGRLSNIFFLKF